VGAGGAVKLAGLNNVEMQLRKVCNHPYLHFGEEQYERARNETPEHIWRSSGKFELLHRVLPKLKALGHRVLIFSQMVKLMDLLQDHLKQYGFKHLRLDGHTKGDDRGALLATFNSDPSYFIFLLSTRAGGQGLNLQAADTVIIFDSDWNPQMDLQAMARAHRIGQKMEVRVLRLITASPIEEKILATANEKLDQEAKIIEAGKFNQTSDASERRETLQRVLAQSADDDVDDAIPTDEEINEMLARPNATLGMTREDMLETLVDTCFKGEEAAVAMETKKKSAITREWKKRAGNMEGSLIRSGKTGTEEEDDAEAVVTYGLRSFIGYDHVQTAVMYVLLYIG
jgi:ATP-dependent helicase STH1/SNF2